uniref:Uncharacterized protein n=1 Tax=Romanomermis culicivorax TaxID=13658 RepID=A0A915KPB8_ROMCU
MREDDNPLSKHHYISFALTNGLTYIIDTTILMEKEWNSIYVILNSSMLLTGYSVLEDLVSIYNVCGAGHDNKDKDKSVVLQEYLWKTKGPHFDLDCFALMMKKHQCKPLWWKVDLLVDRQRGIVRKMAAIFSTPTKTEKCDDNY